MSEQIEQVEDFAEQLLREAGEMQMLAKAYKNARSEYAKCLNKVTVMIYKAGLHRSNAAFENKIPMLIGHPDFKDEAIKVVSKLNESQQEYKGLEMVLKAYQAKISGLQSVVKFMQMGEINAAVAAKYGLQT
ncbi:MAG: hypothetical protein IKR34_02145 [Candidatus Gastranaerophilales bacterium]|nr:hypothetical protein [Elusimicrobiota bacterium]MBR6298024.1 hypothetical protein [Candidatus Gastranaerophilales bacterium]